MTQSLVSLKAPLEKAFNLVSECLLTGHKLLVCGNGGSAAEAAHFATEFVCRFMEDRRPLPALALTDSGSTLTAIANDYDFKEVFARQVRAFGQAGDVLIAFTTSGQSRNVIRALEEAKCLDLASIAFLGKDGGPCKTLASVNLLIPGDNTARIQEAHGFLLHTLCEMVEEALPRD